MIGLFFFATSAVLWSHIQNDQRFFCRGSKPTFLGQYLYGFNHSSGFVFLCLFPTTFIMTSLQTMTSKRSLPPKNAIVRAGELLYSLIQPQRSIFFQVSSSSGRLPPSEATGFHFFDLSQIEKTVEIPQIEYVAPRNATHAGWFSLIQIQMVDLTKCNSESDPKQCGSSFLDLSVQCLRFSEWAKCGISAAFCRSCAYGSKNLLPPKLLLPKICGVQCQQSLDVSTKASWDSLNIKRWRFCGSISKDNHVHIPVQKTRHVHVHVPVERPVEVGYWVGYWDDFDIFLGTPLY